MAVSGTPARQPTNYTAQKTWERASIARRLVAWLVDMTILVVVVLAFGALFGLTRSREAVLVAQDGSKTTTVVTYLPAQWYGTMLAVASALYTIPMWVRWRATLGQRLLGLRTVDASRLAALTIRQAAMRWLVLFGWTFASVGSTIPSLALPFGLTFVAWFVVLLFTTERDPNSQGIHDRYAGSIVQRRAVYQVVPSKPGGSSGAATASRPPTPSAPLAPVGRRRTSTGASRGPRRSTRYRRAKD